MSDLYTEEIVKKEKTGKDTLIKVLLIAGTALSVLSLMILGWVSLILIAVFGVADYFIIPSLDLEFEYLYVNGEIDIDKIMSKQKRKRVFSGDVSSLELLAPSQSHELDHYRSRSDIKKNDFSSGKKDARTYTMILKKEKGMELVVFEPSDVMLNDMKRVAPREVHLQ